MKAWYIDGQFDAEVSVEIRERGTGEVIVEVYPFTNEWTPTEIARVQLAAAAPELLDALKQLNGNIDREALRPYTEAFAAYQYGVAVIAKAEGRS